MTSLRQAPDERPGKRFPDRYKSPVSVLWHITGRCELACAYCYADAGGDRAAADLSDDEALEVARQLVDEDVVHVYLSGGEPLARRPLLERILPLFQERQVIVSLVTSAFGFTAADAALLAGHRVRVIVGLDGPNAEVHDRLRGRSGSFDCAVAALGQLAGRVPTLKALFTATRDNAAQFGAVVDLAAGLGGVGVVEAHMMVERGRALEARHLQIGPAERQGLVEVIAAKMEQYQRKPLCVFHDPTLVIRRLVREAKGNAGCVIWNDGTLLANQWVPLTFGSLRQASLSELWRRGLDDCWRKTAMRGYLSGMRTVNALGPAAGGGDYRPRDFYALEEAGA